MSRIALLIRGVNTGGVQVRSADLRDALASAGLGDVATVLASGNAVVTASSEAAAKRDAEAALAERFGRALRVRAIGVSTLEGVIAAFPFAEDDATTPYVVFELDSGVAERLASAPCDPGESTRLSGSVLFWANPKGTTTNSAFAKALTAVGKDATTTRNLRTLRKIVAAA